MALRVQQNMGPVDRLIRGVTGSMMLLNGLRHIGNSPFRKVEAAIGGAFLAYGVSGFDPLLSAYGATTIAGTENNVFNLMRQALPGQGIKPVLTQYVMPKRVTRQFRTELPLADALAIG